MRKTACTGTARAHRLPIVLFSTTKGLVREGPKEYSSGPHHPHAAAAAATLRYLPLCKGPPRGAPAALALPARSPNHSPRARPDPYTSLPHRSISPSRSRFPIALARPCPRESTSVQPHRNAAASASACSTPPLHKSNPPFSPSLPRRAVYLSLSLSHHSTAPALGCRGWKKRGRVTEACSNRLR